MNSTSKTRTWTGGELVVETLKGLGIDTMYGVPGGQTLAITEAILDEPRFSFVTTRHEGAAAVMADAAGRLTGVPGVCLATTGPGATNLLTGVGGALRDSSPVIVITCNNKNPELGRDDAQNADHVAIFRPLTKWATLVTEIATIPRVLQEAALRATGPNPGPVLVDISRTALESRIELAPLEAPRPARAGTQRTVGDPALIAEAARAVSASKAPVLWVGHGVEISGASDEVLALAEKFDIPVITTFNSIGALPTGHDNVFGAVTRMGTSIGHRVLRGADLIIAIGNSLNAISTARWSIELPPQIIQIDVSGDSLGVNYPARTFGIIGDAKATTAALHAQIEALGEVVPAARRSRIEGLRAAKTQWWSEAEDIDMSTAPMSPAALIKAVRAESPEDTLLVVDAGNPGVWSYLWPVTQVGTYIKPVGFGNMGFGLPAAIAAKRILPGTPVVALIGDGSLGMTMGELETVVREHVGVCLVIMNDVSYGNIRQEQDHFFGNGRNIGVDFADADYAAIARAFGMAGHRAETGDEVRAAVAEILASGSPGLIDARIAPDISAWTFPLFSIKEQAETD